MQKNIQLTNAHEAGNQANIVGAGFASALLRFSNIFSRTSFTTKSVFLAMVWGFGLTSMLFGTESVSAYPIYAQQGYENPREATGRIVCANCHLAQKPVEIEVPQAVLPNTVFEAVVKIPYDQQIQQVTGTGKKGPLNVGAVLILPEGFQLAPPDRISPELQARVGKLYIQPYSEKKPNILIVGPVPGKKYSEMTFPILSPDPGKTPVNGSTPVTYLNYPIYVGGNRGRGQVYPDGKKSNNNVFTSPIAGTIASLTPTTGNGEVGSAGMTIRITPQASALANGTAPAEVFIPAGPSILVQSGDTVTADQPLTENPNVGGFGQEETSIVLQSEGRITGLLVFFAAVCIAQVFLVVKKKQYERVQLSEMNF
jgi:apocytochrome f